MITILIKTFRRPQALAKLLESIKEFSPDIPVIVLDDSNEDSEFGFDIGLSRGRNELVKKCTTPYCVMLEDDCVLNKNTDIKKIIQELIDRNLDILQFKVNGLHYCGLFETSGTEVSYVNGNRNGLYDFCANIFVAKTDTLRKFKWDEDLKLGEHFAYFYEHLGKLKIGVSEVEIEHHQIRTADYQKYRDRAVGYVKQYMKNKGITKRKDLSGGVLYAV